MKPLLLILCILALPTFAASPCAPHVAAQADVQTLIAFLNEYPRIRIGVNHAPGFGHQMSSVHLVRRLRALGFVGEIQVVYEKYTEEKLGVLLPGFDPKGPASQSIPDQKLSFVSEDELRKNEETYEEVGLAFTGAEDEIHAGVPVTDRPSRPERFRAKVLVRLQPANWVEGSQNIVFADGSEISLQNLSALPLKVSPLKEPPATLPAALAKVLGSEKSYERGAIYNAHTDRIFTVRRYLESLILARQEKPEAFRKTSVVTVLSEFTDFNVENLKRVIQAKLESAVGAPSIIVHRLADLPESGIEEDGNIHVIIAAGLDPEASQYVYERSTLPNGIAGRFSRNLHLQLGIPFFEVKFDDLSKHRSFSPDLEALFQGVRNDFQDDVDNPQDPRIFPPRSAVQLLLRAKAQSEAFKAAFEPQESKDKVTESILRLRSFLQEERN